MTSSTPLLGVTLVDCAKANAKSGVAIAARQCGYENNVEAFQTELKKACADMGVEIDTLSDLINDSDLASDAAFTET